MLTRFQTKVQKNCQRSAQASQEAEDLQRACNFVKIEISSFSNCGQNFPTNATLRYLRIKIRIYFNVYLIFESNINEVFQV